MSASIDSLRRDMADLSSAASASERASEEIRKAAEQRHASALSRLDELRARALNDEAAEAEYLGLIAEKARLELVLGNAAKS